MNLALNFKYMCILNIMSWKSDFFFFLIMFTVTELLFMGAQMFTCHSMIE